MLFRSGPVSFWSERKAEVTSLAIENGGAIVGGENILDDHVRKQISALKIQKGIVALLLEEDGPIQQANVRISLAGKLR